MPTDVIMPQMGESIFEGTITKWLKKTGDPVEKDEPLFEISTDKVDAEIPAPVAGVLSEIRFPEGATVQVNAVVAVLSENGAPLARTKHLEESASAPRQVPQVAPKAQSPPPEVPSPQVPGGTEIVMPQMGESIFEGTITKWLKKVGDQVQKDEPLFEISTDKVDAEIPAPIDGILTEIKFGEGETVQVNQVVAMIGGSAPSSTSVQAKSSLPAASAQAQQVQPSVARSGTQSEPVATSTGQSPRSSPLVRRIAREHNIDLARVSGTGSQGRITKDDILGYLTTPPTSSAAPKAESPAPEVPLKDEVVPLSKMRAIIAERMAESKRTIPHAHTVYKVDMTRVVRLRDRERPAFEQRHGVKLTYMPFIAVAAVEALKKFPILNASLEGTSIHYHGNIHLGLAVALEWGLIVPVIRAAEGRDFISIARAIQDLASRARTKKLLPDEVGGSTFTLTNAGAFGGEYGMPIINPPESAILAIGGLRKESVVLTDADGNDTIAVRSMQYYCLAIDHRLIDGADAGKFMTEFKRILESWDRPIA
jgi:2-oxoglutarate dehydrogenase E2 component (dihydrolipoamide succinyltransferase)